MFCQRQCQTTAANDDDDGLLACCTEPASMQRNIKIPQKRDSKSTDGGIRAYRMDSGCSGLCVPKIYILSRSKNVKICCKDVLSSNNCDKYIALKWNILLSRFNLMLANSDSGTPLNEYDFMNCNSSCNNNQRAVSTQYKCCSHKLFLLKWSPPILAEYKENCQMKIGKWQNVVHCLKIYVQNVFRPAPK